jgi:metallo-beta-lactamase family protein
MNDSADHKGLDLNNIKNKLVEIKKSILDLNMLITNRKKEEKN